MGRKKKPENIILDVVDQLSGMDHHRWCDNDYHGCYAHPNNMYHKEDSACICGYPLRKRLRDKIKEQIKLMKQA